MSDTTMVDVVAVDINNSKVLWVMGPRDEVNAEAVIKMAILRQGLEDRFFTTDEPGKWHAGDTYMQDTAR